MTFYRLRHPVSEPSGEELLPANSIATEQTIEALISTCKLEPEQPASLFKCGSIEADALRLMRKPPYLSIFAQEEKKRKTLELMSMVEVAPVVVQVLDFFKAHDPYTYLHKLMVFALSTLLSQEMISDSKDVLREATAGPCHDFGKINVPLKILKKRSPLTKREKSLLEHHTLAGYVLLAYYLGGIPGTWQHSLHGTITRGETVPDTLSAKHSRIVS